MSTPGGRHRHDGRDQSGDPEWHDYAETLEDAVGELLEAWTDLEEEREEVTN